MNPPMVGGERARLGIRIASGLLTGALAAGLGCGEDITPPPTDAGPSGPAPDWSVMATPGEQQLMGVWGRTSTEAYAVGWDGVALRYDGTAWRRETTTATAPLTEVSGSPEPGGPVLAVGWQGTLLIRDPSGAWTDAPRSSTTTADLFGVHLSSATLGFAVGDVGTLLRWDGERWSDVDFSVPSELSNQQVRPRTALAGIHSADGRRWLITGAGGASFVTPDAGGRFEALNTRVSVPLRGVWMSATGSAYAAGLSGTVLRFENRWRGESQRLTTRFLFGTWGASDADVTVVGWAGTALRRFEGEWYADRTGTGVDLRDVWVDRETGQAFAVGARGTILTRTSSAPSPPEPDETR